MIRKNKSPNNVLIRDSNINNNDEYKDDDEGNSSNKIGIRTIIVAILLYILLFKIKLFELY